MSSCSSEYKQYLVCLKYERQRMSFKRSFCLLAESGCGIISVCIVTSAMICLSGALYQVCYYCCRFDRTI